MQNWMLEGHLPHTWSKEEWGTDLTRFLELVKLSTGQCEIRLERGRAVICLTITMSRGGGGVKHAT